MVLMGMVMMGMDDGYGVDAGGDADVMMGVLVIKTVAMVMLVVVVTKVITDSY